MEELYEYMDKYAEAFDDGFPLSMFANKSPKECVRIIKTCLKENKDVYDLGILKLDLDIMY